MPGKNFGFGRIRFEMAIGVIFILANMVFTGSTYTISACSVELVGLNYDRRQNDGYRIWQWPGL